MAADRINAHYGSLYNRQMTLTRRSILSLLAGSSALLAAKTSPRRYIFEYWDVFTRRALQGNPLCVFLDAQGLSDAEMLALARETNLSETTFVLPADRVRIWSPVEEYPFAGHPTLGTAMALRKPGMKQIVLQEKIGPVPVDFEEHADGFVYGEMLQPEPIFAEEHKPEEIARLLNVSAADFLANAPILNVSTGRPNLIVMFKKLATIKTLQPDWPRIREYFAAGDRQRGFYFLTTETEASGARYHARKLTPRTEDPATGSAVGCAAAYFVQQGWVKSGERISVEQGAEVGRPSELFISAEKTNGKIGNVRVGGYAVKSLRGELEL
jgi:trans-2,3-dihydro-3-hydroxyanthranilate isomerase